MRTITTEIQAQRKLKDAKQELGSRMISCHFSEEHIRGTMIQILNTNDIYKIAAVIIRAKELDISEINMRFFRDRDIKEVPVLEYAISQFREKVKDAPALDAVLLMREVAPYL